MSMKYLRKITAPFQAIVGKDNHAPKNWEWFALRMNEEDVSDFVRGMEAREPEIYLNEDLLGGRFREHLKSFLHDGRLDTYSVNNDFLDLIEEDLEEFLLENKIEPYFGYGEIFIGQNKDRPAIWTINKNGEIGENNFYNKTVPKGSCVFISN